MVRSLERNTRLNLHRGVRRVLAAALAAGALALAGQGRSAGQSAPLGEAELLPGEVLVRYRGDTAPFRKLRLPKGVSVAVAIRSLRARKEVLYAGPNRFYHLLAAPDDPAYWLQWNFQPRPRGSAKVEPAWDLLQSAGRRPGEGAAVAVLDTGVAFEDYEGPGYNGQPRTFRRAPDFSGTTFAAPFDVVRSDAHPNDEMAHGTHVAGTIAATSNNGVGAAGIASAATVIPVKVARIEGGRVVLTEADVATGIRWAADHGADVINMSFGGRLTSELIADAVTYAREKGAILVAAAGNDWRKRLIFPASLDAEVLAVSACGYDGTLAPYSTYGQGLALSAPGGNFAQDLNGDLYPDGIVQQTIGFLQDPSKFHNQIFEGTSMAAPHVSGTAALVVGAGVRGEPAVRSILLRSARGARRHSPKYGWGRVDAAEAVRLALAEVEPAASSRKLRVEAVQMLPRLGEEGYFADIRVRVSDERFQPVAGATVRIAVAGRRKSARLTSLTDSAGIARFTASGIPQKPQAVVRARVLSATHPALRFSRPLSGELADSIEIPR